MQLALDVSDLEGLSQPQKDAVLTSLFVAMIADGDPNPEELSQFEQSVATLPWGKDRAQLQLLTRGVVERLRASNDDGKRALMKELADNIPGAALREKVVFDMASIVAADRVATGVERTTLLAFVTAFGLDPQSVFEKIKARLPNVDRAETLGVKLEAADIAALDDAQKVAVLESLITGILADGRATEVELGFFRAVVARLPWGMEPQILDATVKGAAQRVSTLKPAEVSDFILGLAARLPSQRLREKVLYTVATIMNAERDLNDLEKNTLGALILAFGITSDRLRIIKEAVTGRVTSAPSTSAS